MLEKINHKSAPEEVINALLTLYHQGKYDDVLSRSSQLIKEYPHTFVLHNIMGAISFEKGHKEVAIEHFHKVIKLRPHHPHAYNNLGTALIDVGEYQEAKSNLKKAIELQPDYAEAYNNLGNVYKEMEEYNEAIQVYEKAIELNPQYYEAYNNLGVALGKNEQYEEAIEAYKKTISLKPDFAEAYSNMGNVLIDQGKLEESIDFFNKALFIKPDYADAYYNMGLAFQDQGKLEEAIKSYKKAILIKPDDAAAHRNLSSIKLYDAEDEHFHQVKEQYRIGDLNENGKCNLSFALAKMYADIGDFNQSFNYLSKANALRKKLLSYSIKEDNNLFNNLKKTQPYLLKSSLDIKKGSSGLLPVFIVGMPRSGTTLVEQIISSHTEVTGAGELNYIAQYGGKLSINSKFATTGALSDFRKKYLFKLSKVSNGECIVTDKMPHNFRFIPLICAALPEAKIIHVQRDAAATCWSNYKQYFDSKNLGYCYDLSDLVDYYNLYKDLMRLWQSEYKNRIYNLNYETLTTDQENQSRKLIKHLGLNWEKACLSPEKNKRSVSTSSQQQVRKKVYKGSSNAWHKYESYLNGAFDSLPS